MLNSHPLKLQVLWERELHFLLDCVQRFPKAQRFIFSQRIAYIALELLEKIHQCRYLPKRKQMDGVQAIDLLLSRLSLLLRITHDRKYISTGQLERMSRSIQQAGTMVGAWKKYLLKT